MRIFLALVLFAAGIPHAACACEAARDACGAEHDCALLCCDSLWADLPLPMAPPDREEPTGQAAPARTPGAPSAEPAGLVRPPRA
jgi:hypothetical protein